MPDSEAVTEAVETLLDAEAPLEENEIESMGKNSPSVLDILGRTHALAVLQAVTAAGEPRRFSALESELAASPSTLSARLSEFVDVGLLVREQYDEMPPRVEYRPTERAEALAPLFVYLKLWEDRYGLDG